jgi:hypothetical protein
VRSSNPGKMDMVLSVAGKSDQVPHGVVVGAEN